MAQEIVTLECTEAKALGKPVSRYMTKRNKKSPQTPNRLEKSLIKPYIEFISAIPSVVLGLQHTILLSTHILPEVEMTCSRVVIIHKGRIEACDTPENLLGQIRQAGGVVVEAKTGKDDGAEELKKISGVRDVTTDQEDDWKIFSLRVESGLDVREEIFRLAAARKWTLRELSQRRATLEDVFVEITHSDQIGLG